MQQATMSTPLTTATPIQRSLVKRHLKTIAVVLRQGQKLFHESICT